MMKKSICISLLFLGCITTHLQGKGDLLCEWFGWRCDPGAQNQSLIDVGRQRTVEPFLFFDADSAIITEQLQLSFSSRSAALGDYVEFQWKSDSIPAGFKIELDGSSILPPKWHRVQASNEPWIGKLTLRIPPTGNDEKFEGELLIKPFGFERAGTQLLVPGFSNALPMVRIQGEVDSDWHWLKRVIFWSIVFTLTTICSIKFLFAPVFFHPRLKVNKVKVECFPAQGPFANGITPAIQTYKWKGHREIWLVGDRKGKRDKQSLWRDFLYGRTGYEIRDYLGNTEFRIRRTRSRKGRGMRLEVMQFSNGKKRPSSVYSKYEPVQNRVSFNADNEPRILQFDFE